MPFGWDVIGNEIFYFFRPEGKFKKDTFEEVIDPDNKGLKFIIGQPKSAPPRIKERYKAVFSLSDWTLKEAEAYVDAKRMFLEEHNQEETQTPDPEQKNTKPTPEPITDSEPTTESEPQSSETKTTPILEDEEENKNTEGEELQEEDCSLGIELRESQTLGGSQITVDDNSINNVAIIRPKSKNGYTYTEKCLTTAIPLFEGAKVFVDHPERKGGKVSKRRSVRDLVGKVTNIRSDNDHGGFLLRGDLQIPKTGNEHLFEMAQQMPDVFGLSPHTYGFRTRGGKDSKITKIDSVFSVDLVATPGTTTSLFEEDSSSPTSIPNKEEKPVGTETKNDKVEPTAPSTEENGAKLSEFFESINFEDLEKNRPDLIRKGNMTLLEENQRLQTENEEFRNKEAQLQKQQLVEEHLTSGGLVKADCPEIFLEQLYAVDDVEKMDALIADRVQLTKGNKSTTNPKSVPQPQTFLESDNSGSGKKKLDRESLKKKLTSAVRQ